MNYRDIYNNNIDKYNVTEKNYLEQIFKLLSQKDLSNDLKLKYESKLVDILNDLSKFDINDTHYLNMRQEINQRIYTLFTELQKKSDVKKSDGSSKKIEDDIEKFITKCEKLKSILDYVQNSLILSTKIDLSLNVVIKDIDSQLREIYGEADKLKNEIDDFKKLYNNAEISMSVVEIRKIVGGFQQRVKKIKVMQIQQYNAKAMQVNDKIAELKNMTGLDAEIVALISELQAFNLCDINGIKFDSRGYLKNIDYNRLVDTYAKIDEIEKKAHIVKPPTNSYDDDMKYLEEAIASIDKRINDGLSLDVANGLREEIEAIGNRINDINVRILSDKDFDDKDKYLNRINEIKKNLEEVKEKIDKVINNQKNSDYQELKGKIVEVFNDINYLSNTINSINVSMTLSVANMFRQQISGLDKRLSEIETAINERTSEGKLDVNQTAQLNKDMENTKLMLTTLQDKLKGSLITVNDDSFGNIDSLDSKIEQLKNEINALSAPLKDKEIRKTIDKKIEKLEDEIKNLRDYLEIHKDDDAEKYQNGIKRLEDLETKLDEVSKDYRRKCPFLVKSVKSAKNFYKKHKKVCLIAIGLAAIALIHATLGPVIIPAIMHGNMLIMNAAPGLRGVFGGINNVLGKMINAKFVNNAWIFASGGRLSPYSASASLLKGIAISGMGSAAIVGPLVMAARGLINKMNLAELKQKMVEKANTGKEKVMETTKKVKQKIGDATNPKKKVNLEELKEVLFKQYKNSGLSLDEFCEKNSVPNEIKEMLKSMDVSKGGGKSGR